MKNAALLLLASAALPLAARAEPAAKTYGPFFAPVAIEDRNALSVDRSNFTYSPLGINSGVFQVETSVFEYTQDDKIPGTAGQLKQFAFGTTSLRFGMTKNFEAQLITTAHVSARFKDAAGAVTQDDGFGDTLLQTRYTVSGNDGEKIGFALIPYVKLPTNTLDSFNDQIEYGLQAPVSVTVNDKVSAIAAVGFDLNYDTASANSYDLNPFVSAAVWYTATPNLFLFGEVYGKKFTGWGKDDLLTWVGTGGIYQFTKDTALDFGVNIGLSEVAPDVSTRVGITVRF